VANGATYVAGGLVPGSWGMVKGTGLAATTRIWGGSDFHGLNPGDPLPTSLDGVQVKVNNVAAAAYYISPTQINFQVPNGISGTATVQTLLNGVGSNSVTAAAVANSPGIFPVAVGGVNYAAGVFYSDKKLVGNPADGSAFRNARPGDIIQLFATGLVVEPAGVVNGNPTVNGVTVTIGTVTVPADSVTLVMVGEFQINFTVPGQFATLAAGNYPISISVNGVSSPTTINSSPPAQLVLPVQH
jgi:uncharacterized protein (TIGR03437 family)